MTATKLRPKNATLSDASLKVTVSAETWRFIAYIFFWFMCFFAMTVSRIVVAPKLAEGPTAYGKEEGDTCGPFNRVSKNKQKRIHIALSWRVVLYQTFLSHPSSCYCCFFNSRAGKKQM